jgi:hypothetical protein
MKLRGLGFDERHSDKRALPVTVHPIILLFEALEVMSTSRIRVPAILFLLGTTIGLGPVIGCNQVAVRTDASCPGDFPVEATLNTLSVTFNSNESCHDLPLIDGLVQGGTGRQGQYSSSQEEHDAGLKVNPGDIVSISIYFDNGSVEHYSDTARNLRAAIDYDPRPTATHTIRGFLFADNALPVVSTTRGGDLILRSQSPTVLRYVAGSTTACIQQALANELKYPTHSTCGVDSRGNGKTTLPLDDELLTGTTLHLFDLPPGFDASGSMAASFLVTSPPIRHTH